MVKGYDEMYNMDKEQEREDKKQMEEEEERQKMDSEKGRLLTSSTFSNHPASNWPPIAIVT